jgi:hypothetical protein
MIFLFLFESILWKMTKRVPYNIYTHHLWLNYNIYNECEWIYMYECV